ncbi:VWA domain-containing protein [Blastopirellula sp. JC732]|uniref:VWA domain-containing protein n=1 Tax=Blastopirellula sediminis TaxID=2894196 RepID=A0A9X1ML08_9BACT|nr:VWA domain-containing protein [Blastopirellula sediminis]MCC9609048.1 VWA domain-containing protein [Blastopirellula sediminis]MCC9628175.1 VWA domain-containing protein [Blastopirellula sediminis]
MIDALSNFHFLRPYWLLLIPAAIGLWLFWRARSESLRGWRAQIDPELLAALSHGGRRSGVTNSCLLLAGWIIAALAISGPTWKMKPSPFAQDAPPLVILLKADKSMTPADQQTSPLDRAKLKIADLAEARKGQPLGLVAYAGSAHLVLPPTQDTTVVAQMAAEISPEIMPVPGDRLDLAIEVAQRALPEGTDAAEFLVVANSVTEDRETLEAAAKKMSHAKVMFLAIGEPDADGFASIETAARALNASVQPLTVDGQDIERIVRSADAVSLASVTGEDRQWVESGYWLIPALAILVAASFRRESPKVEGDAA